MPSPSSHLSRRLLFESLERRLVLAAPTLDSITDVSVPAGTTLLVALNGHDTDNQSLTFSAASSNTSLFTPTVMPSTNRSLRINVAGFGEMDLQLFENLTPNTTSRIIGLAQSGFYNHGVNATDPMTFHRIVQNFMIQGGDPKGDGSGGSTIAPIGLEIVPDLRFTTKGILAMARGSSTTSNDSQFFITASPQSSLNTQYTIFGFLTAGESVRQAIAAVPVVAQNSTPGAEVSKPATKVVINSIEVYQDPNNGVLLLKTQSTATGYSDITVTVSDGQNTAQRTFRVHTYLQPMAQIQLTPGTPQSLTIPTTNPNSDKLQYAVDTSDPRLTAGTPSATGAFTLTATGGVTGAQWIQLRVRKQGTTDWDAEVVPVIVAPAAPTVEFLPAAGQSDKFTDLDNTAGKTLQFQVSNVAAGATVTVRADSTDIGHATATGTTVVVTTDGQTKLSDGPHAITAIQTLANQDSVTSAPVSLTVGHFPLAGYVYLDANDNGTMDSAEHGLPGVTVALDAKDAKGNWVRQTQTTTGDDGAYRFENLPAGTYRITEVQCYAFWDGKAAKRSQGSSQTVASSNQFSDVAAGPSTAGVDYLFGERGLGPAFASLRGLLSSMPVPGSTEWIKLMRAFAGVQPPKTKAAGQSQSAAAGAALRLAPEAAGDVPASPLVQTPALAPSALQPIVAAAIQRWTESGMPAKLTGLMEQAHVVVSDLPDSYLGLAKDQTIYIDRNAAGLGWFVDPTPATDEEFRGGADGQLQATDHKAAGRVDLLTVVTHELGHIAGLPDVALPTADVMSGTLLPGVRRTPRRS